MALFFIGTFICAIAPGFAVLLIRRIVQSAGARIMLTLAQTVVFTIFPEEKRGSVMGLIGLAIVFAPAIGPVLSGWVVQYLADIIAGFLFMKNVSKKEEARIDVLSIFPYSDWPLPLQQPCCLPI